VTLFVAYSAHAQVSPLMGIGNVQFFDNNGNELTNGVLYSFQAGTSTQQATYTDYTGTVQNPNPIPFSTGGRVTIWLTTGSLYKFVLCLQNDGPFCAAGDVLFSVDQVPGGSTGGSGGGSPFTGIFISGTAFPATAGALRLAAGDSICWRNVAGTANLCFLKDINDILEWSGGSIKFPELASPCASEAAGFDFLWADNTAHRWMMANNGTPCAQVVASGIDINTSDQVVQLHAGTTALPICSTPPTALQLIEWTGTCLGGYTLGPVYSTASAVVTASISLTTMFTVGGSAADFRLGLYISQAAVGVGCSGTSSITGGLTYTDPVNSIVFNPIVSTLLISGVGFGGNTLFPPTTFRAKAGTTISYYTLYGPASGCSPGPSYQVYPVLEQLTLN